MDSDTLVLIGRVAGAYGVRGEVRITAYGEDPMALVAYRDLKRQDGAPALTLLSGRAAKDGLIARAREVASKEAADALKGLSLYVLRNRLPEPDEDEFYLTDLIGLQARSTEGAIIGRVKAVHDFGAGDILEIEPQAGGATWFAPFTLAAVPDIRLAEGHLVLAPAPDEEDSGAEGGEGAADDA